MRPNKLSLVMLLIFLGNIHLFTSAQTIDSEVLMTSFSAEKIDSYNQISWTVFTESNVDYYVLEKSTDGNLFELVTKTDGASSTNHALQYSTLDDDVEQVINYYRLSQFTLDGLQSINGMVSVDNRENPILKKEIAYKTNMLNQRIDDFYSGMIIVVYTDNSFLRTVQ